MRVTALVVTYNRKGLLDRCLHALANQTRPPDAILVVDNASTDGTPASLAAAGWTSRSGFELLTLAENTGGAGGFAAGLRHAMQRGAERIWLMDDDAIPHPGALAALCAAASDVGALYGSLAVHGADLSWPVHPFGRSTGPAIVRVPAADFVLDVQALPFLGLLVSREIVERIGLPDAGFFLAGDDIDYCFRARAAGCRTWLVTASRIEHPPAQRTVLRLPGRYFYGLRLPPWKRYYDVRNRVLIGRRHYGAALYYQTIPGQFVRLLVTLWEEPQRLRQIRAFVAGMVDGLRGRTGRRHEHWGLRP